MEAILDARQHREYRVLDVPPAYLVGMLRNIFRTISASALVGYFAEIVYVMWVSERFIKVEDARAENLAVMAGVRSNITTPCTM